MSHKTKVTLDDGESYIVATVEFFEHMMQLYENQSEGPQDAWMKAVEFIREQVLANVYYHTEDEWVD